MTDVRGWAILAAAIGVNYAEHRRHRSTICAVTRRTFRTDTPAGRIALRLAWAAFSGWLIEAHLLARKGTP